MKRAKNLFPILISDQNIIRAIETVNRTHRSSHGKFNPTVLWVERTMAQRISDLRQIMLNGFTPSPASHKRRYDHSAGKWRDIWEPRLWPDQYIHHMIVQTLQPIMMRGMDYWCCGSIKGRGTQRGIRGIKRWMKSDRKNTKYAAELDIFHFYESLNPDAVMSRMEALIKDRKMLAVIWKLIQGGIMIGAYFSQWFANTVLQPLDHLIREKLRIRHYVRYMDNITIFGRNKKELHRAVRAIGKWLQGVGLRLKGNWQVYRTRARMVTGMGYRYSAGRTILKKRTLLRLKRQLARAYKKLRNRRPISFKQAAGLISRIGMLKHCDSRWIRKRYIRRGLEKYLKAIVRTESKLRNGGYKWNSMYSAL